MLVISEVGALTTEELVTRIQSDPRGGPERVEFHNDRVYCVCAHAGWVCLQTALQSIAFPTLFTVTNFPFMNCH